MTGREDRWARVMAAVATWLRQPATWRGLLLAALIAGGFIWGVVVLGIAMTMAQDGAEQWWLVLVFGLVTLVVVLAGVYVFVNRGGGSRTASAAGAEGAERTDTIVRAAPPAPDPPAPSPATVELSEPLSEREIEVLRLLATGRSNREIAAELYVATGTVKAHLNHIFRKLDARSRMEAVTRARELRLLADREPK
jgi:DNA-binding CsgD family transcriptional regulator